MSEGCVARCSDCHSEAPLVIYTVKDRQKRISHHNICQTCYLTRSLVDRVRSEARLPDSNAQVARIISDALNRVRDTDGMLPES